MRQFESSVNRLVRKTNLIPDILAKLRQRINNFFCSGRNGGLQGLHPRGVIGKNRAITTAQALPHFVSLAACELCRFNMRHRFPLRRHIANP
jgi:hypothetical protein